MKTTPNKDASAEYALHYDPEHADRFAVRILSGKFKNCIYSYGKMGIEETPDGGAILKYDIDIITLPPHMTWRSRRMIRKGRGEIYSELLNTTAWILDDHMDHVNEEQVYSEDDIDWSFGEDGQDAV